MPSTLFGRLLIVTHESLGEKMAGPGIRAWELAKALGGHGVPVILGTPFPTQRAAENVEICQFTWEDPASIQQLIDQVDAVMSTGTAVSRMVNGLGRPIEKPVIVDTYDLSEVERIMLNLVKHEYDFDPTSVFVQEMFVYLRQGDYFTCALENQYDFWLGALLAAGRINESTLRGNYNVNELIGVVPFGLPKEAPVRNPVNRLKGVVPGIGVNDKVLYWGGGIWDWTDPFTFMEALKIVNQKRGDVRAVFGALHHFSKEIVPEMRAARRLVEWVEHENWLGSKVFFLDWIPYDRRIEYLLESDLGVSLAPNTLESRFAIRSRLLDHLWAGLPGVLSKGDEMANLLASVGLAKIVHPGDPAGTAQAILAYLEHPLSRKEMDQRLGNIREQLAWPVAVQPVVEFMRNPRRAPDADQARSTIHDMAHLRREWEQVVSQREQLRFEKEQLRLESEATERGLREEIRALRNSRPVKIADAIGNFLSKFGIKL